MTTANEEHSSKRPSATASGDCEADACISSGLNLLVDPSGAGGSWLEIEQATNGQAEALAAYRRTPYAAALWQAADDDDEAAEGERLANLGDVDGYDRWKRRRSIQTEATHIRRGAREKLHWLRTAPEDAVTTGSRVQTPVTD